MYHPLDKTWEQILTQLQAQKKAISQNSDWVTQKYQGMLEFLTTLYSDFKSDIEPNLRILPPIITVASEYIFASYDRTFVENCHQATFVSVYRNLDLEWDLTRDMDANEWEHTCACLEKHPTVIDIQFDKNSTLLTIPERIFCSNAQLTRNSRRFFAQYKIDAAKCTPSLLYPGRYWKVQTLKEDHVDLLWNP